MTVTFQISFYSYCYIYVVDCRMNLHFQRRPTFSQWFDPNPLSTVQEFCRKFPYKGEIGTHPPLQSESESFKNI